MTRVIVYKAYLESSLKQMQTSIQFESPFFEAPNDEERIKAFVLIQEIMTFGQFDGDECGYGMRLEMRIDLFCYGLHHFHKVDDRLLALSWTYWRGISL